MCIFTVYSNVTFYVTKRVGTLNLPESLFNELLPLVGPHEDETIQGGPACLMPLPHPLPSSRGHRCGSSSCCRGPADGLQAGPELSPHGWGGAGRPGGLV